MGAIDDDDVSAMRKLRQIRNKAVHNLLGFVCGEDRSTYQEDLKTMVKLIEKLDRWWIMEVETPCNADYDGVDVDASRVVSGRVSILKGLIHLASSNQEVSDFELRKSAER
ncbi:hypothetical protein FJY68_12700 [candidate division WOR-3 bacterium]|uniref:Uncharacterized protein n=1 Tax=candidate division WOR-3 bacterium TaxID=2052148 RepID=A0A938BU70_UNCW3|nr:hypothetical protein [candidate division WOR-3 bacterium]